MNNHICILWCYNNFEHIARCFESIYMDNKDYFIIENPSPNSPQIEGYFKNKRLAGYIQFEQNISDNAVKIFFKDYESLLRQYPYITFSDGDLRIYNAPNTFQEIWSILQHPEVGVCTVDLKLDNFPYQIAKPHQWLPAPKEVTMDYVWCDTGSHLLTLENKNLDILLNSPKAIDNCFRMACASKGLRWVKTKINKAYHLTWDYYKRGHPYYEFRVKNPNIFNHKNICNYRKIV